MILLGFCQVERSHATHGFGHQWNGFTRPPQPCSNEAVLGLWNRPRQFLFFGGGGQGAVCVG